MRQSASSVASHPKPMTDKLRSHVSIFTDLIYESTNLNKDLVNIIFSYFNDIRSLLRQLLYQFFNNKKIEKFTNVELYLDDNLDEFTQIHNELEKYNKIILYNWLLSMPSTKYNVSIVFNSYLSNHMRDRIKKMLYNIFDENTTKYPSYAYAILRLILIFIISVGGIKYRELDVYTFNENETIYSRILTSCKGYSSEMIYCEMCQKEHGYPYEVVGVTGSPGATGCTGPHLTSGSIICSCCNQLKMIINKKYRLV